MTNADLFKAIFGLYATEVWAKSEQDFLEWLNSPVQSEPGKGQWEGNQPNGRYRCSECGCLSISRDNFCSNCGADMRGK